VGVVRSELESVLSELEAYSRYYGTVNEEIARQVGTVSKERGELLKRVEKVRKFGGGSYKGQEEQSSEHNSPTATLTRL
jgi:hypothetical protein